ncbi:MAG TPA: N-6 DNA methylase [Puia sp.]|nr:N-6 DNA methylase [Puia sp.]
MNQRFDYIIREYTPLLRQKGIDELYCYELFLTLLFWLYISDQADQGNSNWAFLDQEHRIDKSVTKSPAIVLKQHVEKSIAVIETKKNIQQLCLNKEIIQNLDAELLKTICHKLYTTFSFNWVWSKSNIANLFSTLELYFSSTINAPHRIFTPREVVNLLTNSLPQQKKGSLYDPFCRDNSLLLSYAGTEGSDFNITANVDNEFSYRLSRIKALMLGAPDIDIAVRDIISSHPDRKFDFILTNPPFGELPRHEMKYIPSGYWASSFCDISSEIDILCHSLDHLSKTGRAAIIVPAGFLSHRGKVAFLREKLVINGILEAVIALPAKLFYGTRVATAILILNNNANYEQVLLLNAAELGSRQSARHRLSDDDVSLLVAVLQEYRQGKKLDRKEWKDIHAIKNIEELEKKQFDLQFSTYESNSINHPPKRQPARQVWEEILGLRKELYKCQKKIDQLFKTLK